MPAASTLPELLSREPSLESRFSDLRSVRWRINLGTLPSSPESTIDDLRRVAADSRRRYAGLRKHLLVDPHFMRSGNEASDLVMDNPLSQNPDSTWGQYFRNAELEKMVDQDLSRLYPEHGSYFQTPTCQAMLRRILLLWCLRHPEHGYRQGMHELLAPLLYVLWVDACQLFQVRELYKDFFNDKFDDVSFQENNLASIYNFLITGSPDFAKRSMDSDDKSSFDGKAAKVSCMDELAPNIMTIKLLSDAYGAEGELGIVLSERFMEHDAYCMFDALMSGAHGVVVMADYFSTSPAIGSSTGLPPVMDASSALYHLLSLADSSLHSHLVELGVEPQYFSLRWLRVLFGREFVLEDLLIIWDEIFVSSNNKSLAEPENGMHLNHRFLSSPRGAFIAATAVSMLLLVRSSLLSTENATSCLQRLLNFPQNVDVRKLIVMAKSLQALAHDMNIISPSPSQGPFDQSKSTTVRGAYSPTPGSISPTTPLNLLPESYWEEKWRVLHKAEELESPTRVEGSMKKERLSLSRTESVPSSTKVVEKKKDSRNSIMRRLLEDFEKLGRNRGSSPKGSIPTPTEVKMEKDFVKDNFKQHGDDKDCICTTEEACLNGTVASEENSIFSASTTPDRFNDHDSEKSSVASNLSVDNRYDYSNDMEEPEPYNAIAENQALPDFKPKPVEAAASKLGSNVAAMDKQEKQAMALKERKLLSGKFQWLWKFGRNNGEGTSEKGGNMEVQGLADVYNAKDSLDSSIADGRTNLFAPINSAVNSKEKNVIVSLKHLGQSMLENIQVIESAFQQDQSQVSSLENLAENIIVGKGQVTALTALKDLRKISNLLLEM